MQASTELTLFEDATLRFRYPQHMTKQRGMEPYYFSYETKTTTDYILETFEIEIDPPEGMMDSYRFTILKMPIMGDDDSLRRRLLRRGTSDVRAGAVDCIVTSQKILTGLVEYRWDLLFKLGGRQIYVSICSDGTFAEDRSIWEAVIKSIELVVPCSDKTKRGR